MKPESMYEKSPLGKYLSDLIHEVEAIKKNLPNNEKNIIRVMKVIGSILEFTDDFFRCFDNKKIPSKARLLILSGKYAVILSFKGGLAALNVKQIKKDHEYLLNFFKKAIDGLLKILPNKIENLLPFVNFQQIPAFLNEGFVIDKVKKFLVEKIPCFMIETKHTEIEKIKHVVPAAYYYNEKEKKLFYFNKITEQRIEISVPVKKWNDFKKSIKMGKLKKDDIKDIKKITGHVHINKVTYTIDHLSVDDNLNISIQSSLAGEGVKIKKIDLTLNLDDIYQIIFLAVKYSQTIINDKKEFLKNLVAFVRTNKDPDVFSAANYYLAFINAAVGDMTSENDVVKILGTTAKDSHPFSDDTMDEAIVREALTVQMQNLQVDIITFKDVLNKEDDLSLDDLRTVQNYYIKILITL